MHWQYPPADPGGAEVSVQACGSTADGFLLENVLKLAVDKKGRAVPHRERPGLGLVIFSCIARCGGSG